MFVNTDRQQKLIVLEAENLADAEFLISVGKVEEAERLILERGYTKAYPHGVRYLKKLDKLATSVTQWMKFDNHKIFKDQIYLSHGRKYSFWSKYEQKKSN